MIFFNEIQPKPTSQGSDYGRSSLTNIAPNRYECMSSTSSSPCMSTLYCSRYMQLHRSVLLFKRDRYPRIESDSYSISISSTTSNPKLQPTTYAYSTQTLTNYTLTNMLCQSELAPCTNLRVAGLRWREQISRNIVLMKYCTGR